MEPVWRVWWNERSSSERYGLMGGAALVALVAVAAIYWALRPRHEVLFSGLDPKDASSIASQLGAEGLDYELDPKGGRILVAQDDVYAARIKVMERGLALSGPVGFELFDEADFGMTDFTQQINYQRALEGELSRTIMALDEIDHARLHLVLPESGLFRKGKETPKASLTVVVKRGATLSAARVQGIQRLVAASVPGLESQHVTVHDQMGVALTRTPEGAMAGDVAGERLEAKQINEAYLSRKAQEVLDRAFGPGSAAVMVDVALDYSKRQSTREETLPVEGGVTGAVIRQRTSSAAPRPGGFGAQTTSIAASAAWPPVNTEVEYAVGRNVEQVEVLPGAVQRLTVGVLVPRGLDPAARARMAELVASAIGVDFARGDVLSLQELPAMAVEQSPPSESAAAAPELEVATAASSDTLVKAAIAAALLLILVVWLAVRLAFERGRRKAAEPLTAEQRERLLAEIQQWLNTERAVGN